METNELGYCRYLWICYDILDLALGQDFGLQIIFKIWFRNTELFFKNHFIVPNVFLFRNQGSEEFFRTAGSKMGDETWTPFSQYTVALRMNPAYGGYLQTDKDGNCLGLEIKGGCIICDRKIIIHEKKESVSISYHSHFYWKWRFFSEPCLKVPSGIIMIHYVSMLFLEHFGATVQDLQLDRRPGDPNLWNPMASKRAFSPCHGRVGVSPAYKTRQFGYIADVRTKALPEFRFVFVVQMEFSHRFTVIHRYTLW